MRPSRIVLALVCVVFTRHTQQSTLAALLDRYDRGEFAAVARAIADLPPPPRPWPIGGAEPGEAVIRTFTRLAPVWIDAAGADAAPRRRLVAAAFALELAYARTGARPHRYPLIVWGCETLRASPTRLPGERFWYLASIALLEDLYDWTHVLGVLAAPLEGPLAHTSSNRRFFSRADQLEFTDGHLTHAKAAFPDEPRLLLPPAHYAEYQTFLPGGPLGINSQQTSPALLDSLDRLLRQRFNANPDEKALDPRGVKLILDRVNRIPDVAARYAALADRESIRGDVELRQGFLALRLEAWDEALAHLDVAVSAAREPEIVGLSHLFRGWVFEQTRRHEEAIAAYRAALDAAPLARTTSILLAAQLSLTGRQHEAYSILDAALKASPAPHLRAGDRGEPLDLWPSYRRGDAVLAPSYIARLREAIR